MLRSQLWCILAWMDEVKRQEERRRSKERREREEGGRDLGEQCYKSSSMQKRKCKEKKKSGNSWVKTCFLGKGLSPSKLSTKALCGNTRKRGNEKTRGSLGRERERTCPVKALLRTNRGWNSQSRPGANIICSIADLRQRTSDVGTEEVLGKPDPAKEFWRVSYRRKFLQGHLTTNRWSCLTRKKKKKKQIVEELVRLKLPNTLFPCVLLG